MIDSGESRAHLRSASRILFLLSASVAVTMVGLGIIWPLIPVYAVEIGAKGAQLGLIIASFNIARSLSNPFVGRLSDRWGRKPFMLAGLLLYALVSMLYVSASQVETLFCVRLTHGLASVLVTPIAMAMAADIAPRDRLGAYLGTLSMAVMIGLAAGPVLGGLIRDHFGMAPAFYAMGGLALITLLGVFIYIPVHLESPGTSKARPAVPLREVWRHRVIQGVFLLRAFTAAGQGSVYTFLPLLAMREQLSSSQVGLLLGLNIFLIAFLQRIGGTVADRINPLYPMVLGTFVSGLAVLGMPFAKTFEAFLLLNLVMGVGTGAALPGGFVLAARLGRRMGMGAIMGITDSGWSVGMIVSPILSGLIMDALDLSSVFLAGGLLVMIGAGLVILLLKREIDSQNRAFNGGA